MFTITPSLENNLHDIATLRLAVRRYMLHPVTLLVFSVPVVLRSLHLAALDFPALGMALDHAFYLVKVGLFIVFAIYFQPYVLRWFLVRNVSFLITSYLFFVVCNVAAFTVSHAVLLPDLEKVGGIYWFRLLRQSLLGLFLHFIVCFAIESQVRPLLGRDVRLVPFFRSVPKGQLQRPSAALIEAGLHGDVTALNAQNQYVAVYSVAGKEPQLVRMTFGAAIDRLPVKSGLQVHRSWWLSQEALLGATFDATKMQVDLAVADGQKARSYPVGKTYADTLRALLDSEKKLLSRNLKPARTR